MSEFKKASFTKNKSSTPTVNTHASNTYTKFATTARSTSANNLKYPNYSNTTCSTQSQQPSSTSTSAAHLNLIEDAHLLSPADSPLSSTSFISSLSSSVKSLLNSPDSLSNRLFHPADLSTHRQSCSGSARLINKVCPFFENQSQPNQSKINRMILN